MSKKIKKYEFNIIHDDSDVRFAEQLYQLLTYNLKVKGFCSFQRLPGRIVLDAAVEEIESSVVNICIVGPNISETVSNIFKIAVSLTSKLDQLIFLAYRGLSVQDVRYKYHLYTGGSIIEFIKENDPGGMESLQEEVKRSLALYYQSCSQEQLSQHIPNEMMTARYGTNNHTNDSRTGYDHTGTPVNQFQQSHGPEYAMYTAVQPSSTFPMNVCHQNLQPISPPTPTHSFSAGNLPRNRVPYMHHMTSDTSTAVQPISGPFKTMNTRNSTANSNDETSNIFLNMVVEIGKELETKEFYDLKFLAQGKISEDAAENSKSAIDILHCLLDRGLIDYRKPELLIDMLLLIGRFDLATRVKRMCGIKSEIKPRNTYTNMLYMIASEIVEEDTRKFKAYLIRTQFSGKMKAIEEAKSGMDLLCFLEKEGKIIARASIEEPHEHERKETFNYLREISGYLDCCYKMQQYLADWFNTVEIDGPLESIKEHVQIQKTLDYQSVKLLYEKFLKKDLPLLQDDDGFKDMSYSEMRVYYEPSDPNCKLGEGGFGVVYSGCKLYKGIQIAVKTTKFDCDPTVRKQFIKEKAIAYVKHPFLLPVLAVTDDTSIPRFILMYPLMINGDLSKFLDGRRETKLSWRDYIRVLWQVSRALRFLHTNIEEIRKPIRHGDVKPSNILLDEKLNARLADTGLAEELYSTRSYNTASNTTGSKAYIDPDISFDKDGKLHHGKLQHKTANDVYSFGIVMAQVMLQLGESSMYNLPSKVGQGGWCRYLEQNYERAFWDDAPPEVCDKLKNLVGDCVKDIRQRETIQTVSGDLGRLADQIHELDFTVSTKQTNEGDKKRCVQCLVNNVYPLPATCGCELFCQTCLKTSFRNPLDCPKCLKQTESSIGHHKVYALLIGAPDTRPFLSDVEEVYGAITDPHIMGVRAKNVYRLCDTNNKKMQCWESTKKNLDDVFIKLKERLGSHSQKDVTLMVYISCHADQEQFQIGLTDKLTRADLIEMLKELNFKHLLLICDCCYSANTSVPGMLDFKSRKVQQSVAGGGIDMHRTNSKCVSENIDVFHNDDRCIYQLSSCGTKQKSYFVNGNSLFTQYLVDGLKSGFSCSLTRLVEDETSECNICNNFRKEHKKFIDVSSLHDYIRDHMKKDRFAEGQSATKLEESNDSLKLAYLNQDRPSYVVKYCHKDIQPTRGHTQKGREHLVLKRHPMHYKQMACLKNHLWQQITKRSPELGTLDINFLQVGWMTHSKGKETLREASEINEGKFRDKDVYCQIRTDVDYFYKLRPIVCVMDQQDTQVIEKFLQNRNFASFISKEDVSSAEYYAIQLKQRPTQIVTDMKNHLVRGYENARKILDILEKLPSVENKFDVDIRLQVYQYFITLKML